MTDLLTQNNLWISIISILVFVFILVVAGLTQIILQKLYKSTKTKDPSKIFPQIIKIIKGPIVVLICVSAPFASITIFNEISETSLQPLLKLIINWGYKVWWIIIIFWIANLLSKITQLILTSYITTIIQKTNTGIESKILPPIRRVLPLAIYSIALLVTLDGLGVAISPLLAGFGIGGLAVALAVQPTLSNFFAGTYLVTEGELKEGDFIELDGGPSGYVVDVGWRSTKIRSRFNNLVIIPNSKMVDTIVTNFYSPTPAMNVIVNCGVSYDSNLKQVEEIVTEIANDLVKTSPYAIEEVDPFIGFSNFGDSNIDFFVFLQAKDRTESFILKSELIKRIHQRFEKEDIEINYPVRKLISDTPKD
mgnify:FL=1